MKRLAKIFVAIYYKLKNIRKCSYNVFSCIVLRNCKFDGNNAVGDHTYISHISLGYGSYIGAYSEFSNCVIGKYSSIGNYVRIISATHPTDMVSTYPAFYSDIFRVSYVKQSKFIEHIKTKNGYECEIGNDVWIGDNVLIKGGVTIGDGAIIAMGSIVLQDVAPYSIVGGVPAKEIRKRFDSNTIRELMTIKWWDLPDEWIKTHIEAFEDPKQLISIIGAASEGE